MKKIIIITILLAFLSLIGCASTPKRMDNDKDLIADNGELTQQELSRAAKKIALSIKDNFTKHPNTDGVFVALLPTKNETTTEISTDFFDNNLVSELLKSDVFTVRTETRDQSLKEIQFSMSGLAEKPLSLGHMKSPNYFIRIDITEDMFKSGGDKIVEQVINAELIDVLSQIAVWSDKYTYRKDVGKKGGTSW